MDSHTLSEMRERLQGFIPQIEALRQIGGTVGMSIGVMSHGEVLLDHNMGFQDLERGIHTNSSTKYLLCSLTKLFTAVTIAQLVDEGLLKWSEPITTYIPELSFASDPEFASRLTLIDLLSHRAGLPRLDSVILGADGQIIFHKKHAVAICNSMTPVCQPRSKWIYSNWSYLLAGVIIERVTGQTWDHVTSSRVLKKLGLSQTAYAGSEVPDDALAQPYMILEDKKPALTCITEWEDGTVLDPAGALKSTIHDLLIWGNALLSGYRTSASPLKELGTLFAGHIPVDEQVYPGTIYSMGLMKAITPTPLGKIGFNERMGVRMPVIGTGSEKRLVLYHGAGFSGYNHHFMLVPDFQAVIVVLTNSWALCDVSDFACQTLLQAVLNLRSPPDLAPFADRIVTARRSLHRLRAESLEKGRRTIDTPPEPPHKDLIGTYHHIPGIFWINVFKAPGQLMFNLNGRADQEHKLSHYHFDSFIFFPSADEQFRRALLHYPAQAWLLHFKRNSSKQITHIIWNTGDVGVKGLKFSKVTTLSDGQISEVQGSRSML